MSQPIKPFPVTVHPFPSPTLSSCAYEFGPTTSKNALVFIGGLTSGPHSTPAILTLYDALRSKFTGLVDYSVWEFRMRSSYTGFGYSSLKNDVEDLGALVGYLRGEAGKNGKIVVVGASTGCQAILTYADTNKSQQYTVVPDVDAYILLSPTSDRETASLLMTPESLAKSVSVAKELIQQRKKDEIMPREYIPPIFDGVPVSAYRWNSLVGEGGDEDFFSSDLSDAQLATTFGLLDKPTLIIVSEKDEMVPETVDKEALLERWRKACKEGFVSVLSGVNPGAGHGIEEGRSLEWVVERIGGFLGELEGR